VFKRKKILALFLSIFTLTSALESVAVSAHADSETIYGVNQIGPRKNISKAAADGSGIADNYIAGLYDDEAVDGGMSVHGDYVYWASGVHVVRAKKDGTGVPQIIVTNTSVLNSVATDSKYLYWDSDGPDMHGAIGRSLLDGSMQNPSFIVNTSVADLGTDNFEMYVNNSYIYWANYTSNTIGRANIDGTGINASFITIPATPSLPQNPCGVWVQGSYIYWASFFGNAIGRANLDGSNVNTNFINTGDGSNPYYVVTDSKYIYWTTTNEITTVARANLDGTGQNNNFIVETTGVPNGLWVDELNAPVITPVAEPVPDPVQLSKVSGIAAGANSSSASTPVVIQGNFVERVTNVQVNSRFLPEGSWVQTPTSISFTLGANAAGTFQVQLYNGSAPVLPTQSITLSALIAKPTELSSSTAATSPATPVNSTTTATPSAPVARAKVIYIHCVSPEHGLRVVYGVDPVCKEGYVKQ